MAANFAMAAAQNPHMQAAARDVAMAAVQGAQGATMDKLVAKEREIAARMQNLKERQQQVMHALQSLQPNWPPCHCLCIQPIVYHDIAKAVPADRMGYAKSSYTNYGVTIFIIVYNIICAIAGFATETKQGVTDETSYSTHFGLSLLHLLGIPGAFMVWHFQIYRAVQPVGQLTRYGTAYLGICIALLYDIFMAIGIPGFGGCGFMYALKLKDNKASEVPFILSIICAVFYSLQAVWFVWAWFRLRKYHRQDKTQQAPAFSLA
jgi:hypothetical protein